MNIISKSKILEAFGRCMAMCRNADRAQAIEAVAASLHIPTEAVAQVIQEAETEQA